MAVPVEEANQIYRRLLANEPDAPADLVEMFLDPLVSALNAKFPAFSDPAVIESTVIEVLFKLIQDPTRYHPAKGSLWTFLNMDANGDLINEWQKIARRRRREVSFDLVAHDGPARNNDIEDLRTGADVLEQLPAGMSFTDLIAQLRQDIPDEADWAALELMLAKERRTEVYAQVLNISDRSQLEQRRLVKQVKDRLRVRLKRRGVRIRE